MGIKSKGFPDWIAFTFPEVTYEARPQDRSFFSTVCIDVNPLLHICLRSAKDETQFVKKLFVQLDRCLRLTIPTATVYLAVDGSPPLAKMKMQIKRRLQKSRSTPHKDHIDISQITPGCSFQLRVTEYLHYYAARYLSTKGHNPRLRFIIDGAETAGEGEAKIAQYLYLNDRKIKYTEVAIYSGDSDVLVQALLSPVQHIYVLRAEAAHHLVFSLARLRNSIHSATCDSSASGLARTTRDFCLLAMFCGNDYMHKLRGGRINVVWPTYVKFRMDAAFGSPWFERFVVRHDWSIDFDVLQELLIRVRPFNSWTKRQSKLSKTFAMLDMNAAHHGADANHDCKAFEELEYREDNEDEEEGEDEDDEVAQDSHFLLPKPGTLAYTKYIPNYLQAILWTLNMFRTGTCSDVTFTQIGNIITIDQVLEYLSSSKASKTQLILPHNTAYPAFLTIICPITLLDISKTGLVPLSWQSVFTSSTIRQLTQSLVDDATLVDEAMRVQKIMISIGSQIVELVDPSSPMVRVLTQKQNPVVIFQSKHRSTCALSLIPLGTSEPEIWHGVKLRLPQLKQDPSIVLQVYEHDAENRQAHLSFVSETTPSTLKPWPFATRSENVLKPKLNHFPG